MAVARRFRGRGVPFEDLLQAARLGLVQAASRFDPTAGAAFATYAVPVVLGEVRRLVERSGAAAGARGARSLVGRAARVRRDLACRWGREPTLAEVAEAMGVEAAELASAIGAVSEPLPLEHVPAEGAGASGDVEAWTDRLAVRQALACLPAEWRRIVYLRYYRGWSQGEVARALGISQPTVSRRERAALAALRHRLDPAPETGPPWRHLPEG